LSSVITSVPWAMTLLFSRSSRGALLGWLSLMMSFFFILNRFSTVIVVSPSLALSWISTLWIRCRLLAFKTGLPFVFSLMVGFVSFMGLFLVLFLLLGFFGGFLGCLGRLGFLVCF